MRGRLPGFVPAVLLVCWPVAAQREQAPSIRSAEAHADGTITFRLRAPKASEVAVTGDFLPRPMLMHKDTKGLWTYTTEPLEPAIYGYAFVIDGVRVADPGSGHLHPSVHGVSSMVEVPGSPAMFYDPRPVPHGEVHVRWYESKAIGGVRSFYTYTPPGYEKGGNKYPVLYLLHGSGDTEAGWITIGRANLILDNLIADHKAVPMVVVMPFGHAQPSVGLAPDPDPPLERIKFVEDLLQQVMPMAESEYRINARPEKRAIAGLSMGGGQSLHIGLTHLELFRWIGVFSAGRSPEEAEATFPDAFADPDATNKKLKLFWIGCGKADSTFARAQDLDAVLTKHGIHHVFVPSEGAHNWRNWRIYLNQVAPLLFR